MTAPRRVLVVGGGIAAVEALMALADLGDGRLRLHVVADRPDFVMRPQLLGEPWGEPALRLDLEQLCDRYDAGFTLGTVTGVDVEAREVFTTVGGVLPYERLLLAPGARPSPASVAMHALGTGPLPQAMADGDGSVAIVVPPGTGWTLPAYELALHAAGDGRDVRVLTPERVALEAFGPRTHEAVRDLLDRHGVVVEAGRATHPDLGPADAADTVVALPLLNGPAIAGLPLGESGFLRVDARMAVPGVDDVHAAGDATDGAIRQGGLAAQQADTAAAEIVRSCGGDVPPVPYAPVLRGRLTTREGEDLYLRRALDGRDRGRTHDRPLWQPAGAVCAWRVARWLQREAALQAA